MNMRKFIKRFICVFLAIILNSTMLSYVSHATDEYNFIADGFYEDVEWNDIEVEDEYFTTICLEMGIMDIVENGNGDYYQGNVYMGIQPLSTLTIAQEWAHLPRNIRDNCVLFARHMEPSLPFGLTYHSAKVALINSHTPVAGAIAIHAETAHNRPFGHISFVESVVGGQPVTLHGGFSGFPHPSGGMHIVRDRRTASAQGIIGYWHRPGLVPPAQTVTVSFNANGGSPTPANRVVTRNSTYGTLPTVTRTGHTFAGWWTAATGGSQVFANTTVTNTSNHTLFARWTPVSMTVTFDANGGRVAVPGGPSTGERWSRTVTFNGTYGGSFPSATRLGEPYSFSGWWTAREGGTQVFSSTIVTRTNNHTLYARWTRWTPNNVTITFNSNGGTPATFPDQVGIVGERFGHLPKPTHPNYNFQSWNHQWRPVSDMSLVQGGPGRDVYLWALWAPPTFMHSVTFDSLGGSLPANISRTRQVFNTTTPFAPPIPTKVGYNFMGWWTSLSGGTQVRSIYHTAGMRDRVLLARWERHPNSVSLDPRGGRLPSGFPLTGGTNIGILSVRLNEFYNGLENAIPTRAGYRFDGWFTAPTGGTIVTRNTIVTRGYNHTLFARWTVNPPNQPPSPPPPPPQTQQTIPLWRMFNPSLNQHLWTTCSNEYRLLATRGWRQEGIAWHTPRTGRPVHRLFHPGIIRHHYTADQNEIRVLRGRGWNDEGVIFFCASPNVRPGEGIRMTRLFHPGSLKHLHTADANEVRILTTRYGWRNEGESFVGLRGR